MRKVCLDKQKVVNKLYGAYKQMLESGHTEKAKGMWRAIKLINQCAVFEIKHTPEFFIDARSLSEIQEGK